MRLLSRFILAVLCSMISDLSHCAAYLEDRPFSVLNKRYCRLKEECRGYRQVVDYNYGNLSRISSVPNSRPDGYLLRFPFYAIATHDVHVTFTTSEHPNYGSDAAYEIVIGGWNNAESVIRRGYQKEDRYKVRTPGVLSTRAPLKMLIDILNSGEIRVYVEHEDAPILKWTDPNPLPIKYFGFASWPSSLNRYFFNCPHEQPETQAHLEEACRHTSVTGYNYADYIPISSAEQKKGFMLHFPVYVLAAHDAHILLTPRQTSDGDVYEIVLGAYDNRRVLIRRHRQSAVLADVALGEVLTPNDIYMVLVRVSEAGAIEVHAKRAHSQYKLLASAIDPHPLDVKYISFASWDTANGKYYYQCSMAPPPFDDNPVQPTHPLLNDPPLPPNFDKKNVLASRCSFYTNSDYLYSRFIPLSEIRNSRPPGYIVRIAVYAQGARDVHIALTENDHPKSDDPLYEIPIGAWDNSRILIRRRKQESVLNDQTVFGLVSAERPTKIVVEITEHGRIRVFTEGNKHHPVITAVDEKPLHVKYLTLASFSNSKVDFYYNCNFD